MSLEQIAPAVESRGREDARHVSHLLFYGAIVGVLLIDQLSKAWVVENLSLYQPTDLVPWLAPVLSFTSIRNTGVAFGLFQGLGSFFAVFSILVLVGVFAFRRTISPDDLRVHLSLGLVVGGALGNNIVDRLLRGHVVDFLDVNFWPLQNWPVFNIADSAIVVGVAVLLLDSLLAGGSGVSSDGD
ncbi:MAG: signal peptidase II [Anaerolineae bacterium]|nr:signal peptidase II [Anaerolineae bacterium]